MKFSHITFCCIVKYVAACKSIPWQAYILHSLFSSWVYKMSFPEENIIFLLTYYWPIQYSLPNTVCIQYIHYTYIYHRTISIIDTAFTLHVKKLKFLAGASAMVLTPPPALSDFMHFFFYMYKFIYFWKKKGLKWMILKEKKKLVIMKNNYILRKYWKKLLTNTLDIISQNVFAYSFVSEHCKAFFLFCGKKNAFLADAPHPLTDKSAKNPSFFTCFLNSNRPILLLASKNEPNKNLPKQ